MAWPTAQDYNEAVQNPRFNFQEAVLKTGQVELNPLGLPRPRSGNFATVYRMQCGQSDWAVRCFLREFADQQQRYDAISQHLASIKLSYMVDFEFIQQGILVKGLWYPILKMAWAKGELLHTFIEKHLHDSAILQNLANRWITMIHALEGAQVAHGDLQHGNIVVVNNDFKLIDYDGMFVPALAGWTSNEVGHENYQHPSRTGKDFRADIDRFSAWVIYIALISLSRDPQLWQRLGAGDEFILLRKTDFVKPDASATLALLIQHSDARIRSLATRFRQLLRNPSQFPLLDKQNQQRPSTTVIQPAVTRTIKKPDWLTHTPIPQKSSPVIQSPPISFQWALIKRLISNRLDPIRLFVAVFVLFIALVIFWPSSSPNESPSNDELLARIPAKIEPPAAPTEPKIVPLTVRSNVDNNTVFINDDNKNYGSTPLDVNLPPGLYTVRVVKDGYFPFEKQIDLQQAQNLRVKLQPKPKQLIISSNINNATVSINRKNYGSTPVNVKLPPAFYTVQVLKDGYFPFEKQIDLQQAQNLRVKLRPIDVDTQNGPKYPVPSVAFTLTALKPVVSVAFAPDSQTLVSGGHTVKLWQISTGQPRDTLIQDKVVMSVSFSPDGHKLAWSSHNEIILWDVNTGQPLHTLTGHKNLVMSVSFSPDGHTLASASSDKTIKLWDVRTGQPLHTLTGHKDSVMSVSFSPDGRTLASGSRDQTIKLWEISRAKLLHTLIGHKKMVWSVAYTPDGRILASGSKDKTIKLWKVSSGKALHSLTGHKYGVRSISFSPDGRVLASGSNDNTIKLWAVSTGKRLHSLTGHKKGVLSVCFSPDGSRLASGSDDKTIKLWSSK